MASAAPHPQLLLFSLSLSLLIGLVNCQCNSTCLNGASCNTQFNKCVCPNHYYGMRCEVPRSCPSYLLSYGEYCLIIRSVVYPNASVGEADCETRFGAPIFPIVLNDPIRFDYKLGQLVEFLGHVAESNFIAVGLLTGPFRGILDVDSIHSGDSILQIRASGHSNSTPANSPIRAVCEFMPRNFFPATCPPTATVASGACFVIPPNTRTYARARDSCDRTGGDLIADLNDVRIFKVLKTLSLLKNGDHLWVGGLFDDHVTVRAPVTLAGNWINSSPSRWPHPPDPMGSKNCVAVNSAGYLLRSCTDKLAFVCQYNAGSLTDPCDSSPCSNGGTCLGSLTGRTCVCPVGYEGSSCESQIAMSTTPSTTPSTTVDSWTPAPLPPQSVVMSTYFNDRMPHYAFDGDSSTCAYSGLHSVVRISFNLHAPVSLVGVRMIDVSFAPRRDVPEISLYARSTLGDKVLCQRLPGSAIQINDVVDCGRSLASVEALDIVATFDRYGQVRICDLEVLVAF